MGCTGISRRRTLINSLKRHKNAWVELDLAAWFFPLVWACPWFHQSLLDFPGNEVFRFLCASFQVKAAGVTHFESCSKQTSAERMRKNTKLNFEVIFCQTSVVSYTAERTIIGTLFICARMRKCFSSIAMRYWWYRWEYHLNNRLMKTGVRLTSFTQCLAWSKEFYKFLVNEWINEINNISIVFSQYIFKNLATLLSLTLLNSYIGDISNEWEVSLSKYKRL